MKLKYAHIVVAFMVGYFVFGLGLSAVPNLSKLGFVFAFIGGILLVAFPGKKYSKVPFEWYAYSGLYLYLLATYLWSPVSGFAPVGGILTVYFAALFIALSIHYKLISPLLLVLLCMIPGVINLVAYILGINYVTEIYDIADEAAFQRFGGFIGHPNAMVSRIMLPIFISVIFARDLVKSRAYTYWILPLSILFGVFAVYSSGSKKALVFFLIAVPLIISFYPKVRSSFLPLSISGVIAMLFYYGGGGVVLSDSSWEVLVRIDQTLQVGDESTAERVWMLFHGWDIFLGAPFFGEGLDAFSYFSGLGYYSHNNIIELLVSGGLFAAVLYYGVFFTALIRAGMDVSIAYMLGVFILFVAFDFTSVSFSDRGIQLVFSLFVFVFLSKRRLGE